MAGARIKFFKKRPPIGGGVQNPGRIFLGGRRPLGGGVPKAHGYPPLSSSQSPFRPRRFLAPFPCSSSPNRNRCFDLERKSGTANAAVFRFAGNRAAWACSDAVAVFRCRPAPGRSALLFCHAPRPPPRTTAQHSAKNAVGLRPTCFFVAVFRCRPAPGRSALLISSAFDSRSGSPASRRRCPRPRARRSLLPPRLRRSRQRRWTRLPA